MKKILTVLTILISSQFLTFKVFAGSDGTVDIKSKIHMKQSGLHWKGFFALGEELTSGKPDNKEGIYKRL